VINVTFMAAFQPGTLPLVPLEQLESLRSQGFGVDRCGAGGNPRYYNCALPPVSPDGAKYICKVS
jgi:hypothetical protein